MPREGLSSLDRRDRSEKRPAPLADRFAVWVGFGNQQPDEFGCEATTESESNSDSAGPSLPARPSVSEGLVVVPTPVGAATEERTDLEISTDINSAERTVGQHSPPKSAENSSNLFPLTTNSSRRWPPINAQQEDIPHGGTQSESEFDGESLVLKKSSVDAFETTDRLLFPDSAAPSRGEESLFLLGGNGDENGRGVLGLAGQGELRAAELAAASAIAAEFMPVRLGEHSADVWMMSRTARFLSVVAFWTSHTCSVYATKALLSRPGRTIRTVVLITWFQCLASFMLVLSLGTLGERQDSKKGAWRSGLLTEMARALPINPLLGGWNSKSLLGGGAEAVGLASVLFSLAVLADNACLAVVNASFFQVARALTLPFVTLMGAFESRTLPQRDLLLPCVLCLLGFYLGVYSQTPEAFADGTSMGMMASLLTAAYTRLLARAEPKEAWRVTYVTNRNASVILLPVAVYVGMGDPNNPYGVPFLVKDGPTILVAVMATVLPAVAGVCTMWQAQARLGARGLAASSVGRAAFSHLLAFRVFGNAKVLVGEIGCGLVLTGLALYASCRGGAAVAQAGNVAAPGAAREHFLRASSTAPSFSSSPEEASAPSEGPGKRGGLTASRLGKKEAVGYLQ